MKWVSVVICAPCCILYTRYRANPVPARNASGPSACFLCIRPAAHDSRGLKPAARCSNKVQRALSCTRLRQFLTDNGPSRRAAALEWNLPSSGYQPSSLSTPARDDPPAAMSQRDGPQRRRHESFPSSDAPCWSAVLFILPVGIELAAAEVSGRT